MSRLEQLLKGSTTEVVETSTSVPEVTEVAPTESLKEMEKEVSTSEYVRLMKEVMQKSVEDVVGELADVGFDLKKFVMKYSGVLALGMMCFAVLVAAIIGKKIAVNLQYYDICIFYFVIDLAIFIYFCSVLLLFVDPSSSFANKATLCEIG